MWGKWRAEFELSGPFVFEKDSLPKASEKCGLVINLFCHSEKRDDFHDRAIAALAQQ
jgi:hypothetical protein